MPIEYVCVLKIKGRLFMTGDVCCHWGHDADGDNDDDDDDDDDDDVGDNDPSVFTSC